MEMTKKDEHGIETKCRYCGKKMYILFPGQYAYVRYTDVGRKVGRNFFCKYTCMTAYDRNEEAEKKKRKKRTSE